MMRLQQIAIFIVCSTILHFSLLGADMGYTCDCEKQLSFQWNNNDLTLSLLDSSGSCLSTPDLCNVCKRRQRLLDEFYRELPNIKPHDNLMAMAARETVIDEDEMEADEGEIETDDDMETYDELSKGKENDINADNREQVSSRAGHQEQEKLNWEERLLKKQSYIEDRYKDLLKSNKSADQCARAKAQAILNYLERLASDKFSGFIPAWRCIPCSILDGNDKQWAHSSNCTYSPAHLCGRCEKVLRGPTQDQMQ